MRVSLVFLAALAACALQLVVACDTWSPGYTCNSEKGTFFTISKSGVLATYMNGADSIDVSAKVTYGLGKTVTLNWKPNKGCSKGSRFNFNVNEHPQFPTGCGVYCISWASVGGTNCRWGEAKEKSICGISLPVWGKPNPGTPAPTAKPTPAPTPKPTLPPVNKPTPPPPSKSCGNGGWIWKKPSKSIWWKWTKSGNHKCSQGTSGKSTNNSPVPTPKPTPSPPTQAPATPAPSNPNPTTPPATSGPNTDKTDDTTVAPTCTDVLSYQPFCKYSVPSGTCQLFDDATIKLLSFKLGSLKWSWLSGSLLGWLTNGLKLDLNNLSLGCGARHGIDFVSLVKIAEKRYRTCAQTYLDDAKAKCAIFQKYQDSCKPKHCSVSNWGCWSKCSASCGGGVQTRSRRVLCKSANGGSSCPALTESQACNSQDCPKVVDCATSAWSAWSTCSATCNGGVQTRTRTVTTQAANGGAKCPSLVDSQQCNTQSCPPINCQVSDWSAWTTCSATCGGGSQTRTRKITTWPSCQGAACPDLVQTQQCNTQTCRNPNCVMGSWGAWSSCSASCGGGVQTRTRTVTQPRCSGGAACGPTTDSQPCNTNKCPTPVDCKLSDWSAWSTCSASCGTGQQTRSRTVTQAPANGGALCATPLNDSQDCNTQDCPVNCIVSDWTTWSSCSATCGGGTQLRSRTVIVDKQNGGADCGDLNDAQTCNTEGCPIDCEMGEWGEWSTCSSSCGGGVRSHSRAVITESANGGATCSNTVENESCNTNPCPVDCQLGDWGAWSTCSAVCGGGTKIRTKSVIQEAQHCGDSCPLVIDEADCNTAACTDVPPFTTCTASSCGDIRPWATDVNIGSQGGAALIRFDLSFPQLGDIRGVFFNMPGMADAEQCSVTLSDDTLVSAVQYNSNQVDGTDVSMKQCPTVASKQWDVAVQVGTSSIAANDDVRSVTVIVACPTREVGPFDFINADFGVQITSMGTEFTNYVRSDSSTQTCSCPPTAFPDTVVRPAVQYGRRRV